MKLSVIIPVFNEEKSIVKIIKKIHEMRIPQVQIEIIVVDDGSIDQTVHVVNKYLRSVKTSEITFLLHKENKGKGAAVATGIKHAHGDFIFIQDADLEYDPGYLPILLQPVLLHQSEVVYGTRLNRLPDFSNEEGQPLFILHYIGNRLLSLITSLLYGQWITDMETCYKLFPRSAVSAMHLQSKGFEFEPEITAKLLKMGYKIKEIPIATKPRGYNEGKKLNALREGPKALWILIKYRFRS